MKEKDLMKLLDNHELMSSIIGSTMEKDFYVIKKKPVYSLKECLEAMNDKVLETIYVTYKYVFMPDKLKDDVTRKQKIELLNKGIIEVFKNSVMMFGRPETEVIDNFINQKKIENPPFVLLNNGFLYAFREKEKIIFVIPSELVDLYKEYVNSDEKKEMDEKKDYFYLTIYMLIYGIVPKEMIEKDLPNMHHFSISKKQIKEFCKENLTTYKNGAYYTVMPTDGEATILLDKILEIQIETGYKTLDELEFEMYMTVIENFYSEMEEIFKNKTEKNAQTFLITMISTLASPDDVLEILDVPKNKRNKVHVVLENYYEEFRYWPLGGRTIEEAEFELLKQDMILKQKPEDENLASCLKNLSKDGRKEICEYYGCSKDSQLGEEIETEAMEILEYYDEMEIQDLIEDNKTEAIGIESSLIRSGIVYLYYEKDVLHYLIPTDIINILESAINDNLDIPELVSEYVDMNGIIEKDKVQELLETYHDIHLSIKELDDICLDEKIIILEKKYYTFIEDFPKEEISSFINQKQMFSRYKKVDMEAALEEKKFRRELTDLLYDLLSEKIVDDVYHIILNIVKDGTLSKDNLIDFLESNGIKVADSVIRKIVELYKKYKEYISVWSYNGYSVTEIQTVKTSEKIGRNDPCPCGSGKKYKKCCLK